MKMKIIMVSGVDPVLVDTDRIGNFEPLLVSNIAFNLLMARVKLWRVREKIPHEIEKQAEYWKRYYNTSKGSGSVEKFINIVSP